MNIASAMMESQPRGESDSPASGTAIARRPPELRPEMVGRAGPSPRVIALTLIAIYLAVMGLKVLLG